MPSFIDLGPPVSES